MKLHTLILLCLFSLSIVAQSDKQEWKDLERWGKTGQRRYAEGEEIKRMIKEAERRDASRTAPARTTNVITNNDILKMKSAGFADSTIINAIETRAGWFDTSAEALILLNRAGISEAIVNAMLQSERENSNKLIPTDKHGLPTEVGIYMLQTDGYVEIDAEPISWQSGGNLKSAFSKTGAIAATMVFPPAFPVLFFTAKGHINAKVMNPRSRYAVARNTDVILRTPEGVTASEYLLVQLYEKDNRREFRLLTGGVLHGSSGAERTAVSFTYTKIAPRTYAVNLGNLASGEYGFLPTFDTKPTNAAFVGKLYAFSID